MKKLTGELSNQMITKLMVAFFLMILFAGSGYVITTFYFTNKYFEEASQKLHAQVASHIIEEKFGEEELSSPFLTNGDINKAFFGDLMHDMMAVNRGIEVYLLNPAGEILYSVVLNHDEPNAPVKRVDLQPIREFIDCKGEKYVLGTDPRDEAQQKIFSAAAFEHQGQEGYLYIVLAGQAFEEVNNSLLSSYFIKLGLGVSLLTVLLAALLGVLAIRYVTRNLRQIIYSVRRFKEGDLEARIPDAAASDLSVLANSFNEMADTIVSNIEEIKSVDALRRELIANVSHDLRTPLAIMQGYIETLQIKQDELSDARRAEYLQTIRSGSEKLSRMIAQLFEYSKLEAKQIKPEKEPFAITDLAYDIYSKYQVVAEKQQITLDLDVQASIPLVFADISLVERAIQNLMDNAIKFTPASGKVSILIESSDKSVSVSIKDTGPGIPEEQQAYIFERFKQAESRHKKAGAGLGLAIASKILEIHDSTIQVISRPNEGAIFQFQLPAYTAAI